MANIRVACMALAAEMDMRLSRAAPQYPWFLADTDLQQACRTSPIGYRAVLVLITGCSNYSQAIGHCPVFMADMRRSTAAWTRRCETDVCFIVEKEASRLIQDEFPLLDETSSSSDGSFDYFVPRPTFEPFRGKGHRLDDWRAQPAERWTGRGGGGGLERRNAWLRECGSQGAARLPSELEC